MFLYLICCVSLGVGCSVCSSRVELGVEVKKSEFQYKFTGQTYLIFQIILNTILEPYSFFSVHWGDIVAYLIPLLGSMP